MRTNLILILVALLVTTFSLQAQDETLEELQTMLAEKQSIKDGVDKEIGDLDKKIKEFPGWSKGFAGTIGFDFGGLNNWYSDDIENVESSGLGISLGAYANKNNAKSFWHNSLIATANKKKATNDYLGDNGEVDPNQQESITSEGSFFALNSLGGYGLTDKIYVSAEGRYETTIFSFNDPGKLTFSAGFTYKPINNLVIVVHPLGYQWNFPSGDFSSTSGAKIGATYTGEIIPGITWNSSLNAFYAYSGDDSASADVFGPYDSGDLTNWTWINGFTIANVFKGIGVGLTLGLRSDPQLGYAKGVSDPELQSFYTLGLSYAL